MIYGYRCPHCGKPSMFARTKCIFCKEVIMHLRKGRGSRPVIVSNMPNGGGRPVPKGQNKE